MSAKEEKLLANIFRIIARGKADPNPYRDALSCIRQMDGVNLHHAHKLLEAIQTGMKRYRGLDEFRADLWDVHKKTLCFCATECFDDYVLYMEIDRPFEKQFYLPRRKQLKPIADALQQLEKREIELLTISLPPGVGKALANDTPILTRDGWKRHGDLQVGDEVIGMDGRFKKVVAVHPKCQLDCLVEFTNGEKIVCHENHEWLVHDRARHIEEERDYIAETKYLESRKLHSGGEEGHRGHRLIMQLPYRKYVCGVEKELPLDPYTFGVWLGDGANKNPRICCAPKDKCVIDRIVANGHPIRWSTVHKGTGVLYFDFDMRRQLQSMGMCHSRKIIPKHIPECYLTASVRQRLELLAGLIDTDGTLCGSKYQFTTSEIELRDTFADLVSTFGWRVSVSEHAPCVSSTGVHARRPYFVVGFTPDCEIPCELERKRNKEPHQQRRIAFKSITRIEPQEGNCITVEGDGMYLAGKTMLPTHNTTLAEFFLTWTAGKHWDQPNLIGSHSNSFLRGVYGELLRFLDPNGDYKFNDVFPLVKVVNTNAQDMMIDLGEKETDAKRFATLELSSVGSGNAGKVRAGNLLYCDDLVPDLETALSKERMDKLYNQYATDLRQRKIGNAAELHIATRWSVHDCIGRLQRLYEDDPKCKFLSFPALNDNDESNFDYPIAAGFTTKFYLDQREAMPGLEWKALYMNEPIEREGQLYPEDSLRRYFELPSGEPDAILAVCDTKDKGADYCVLPIAYQYGQDFYIEAVVCENYAPAVVDANLISALVAHRVQMCQFESNSAGGRVAEKVQNGVRERGGITKITTKWTSQNKETKIIVNAPFVQEHFLFKDKSVIGNDKEYRTFLSFLTSYTMAGKNPHDDVPDAMAQFALYVQNLSRGKIEVFSSPFRL